MKILRFLVGRGELVNAIGSALRQSCLNPRNFRIHVIEFVSRLTTTIRIVVCRAVAIAAFHQINLVFRFLVWITRWIFASTLLLIRWIVVFVTKSTIVVPTTIVSAFTVWTLWAIGWVWCHFPVRVAITAVVTKSTLWIGFCSSLIGRAWRWLFWSLFWWRRYVCYFGLKCEIDIKSDSDALKGLHNSVIRRARARFQ